MTPDKGCSIDVQRRRRIGLILPIVLLTTPFAAVNVQAAGYDPASDVNSMASTTDYTGAQAWWAAGYTGQGVDVALIDSGVAPVQGLNSAGKVISGPDLSLESQAANLANLDTFGHGTFIAGKIGYAASGSAAAMADPAYDKRIIAVAASDSMGTMTITDDTMPDCSAAAKTGTARAPDFVAPGVHIQGLRVLNSWIDTNIDGKTILDDRFMRGSGTSESAAITSGAVALILSKFPNATPAQVKKMLKDAAYDMPTQNSRQVGSGEMRLAPILTAPLPVYSQGIAPATGGGSLELARGSDHLTRDGVVLKGEQDIFAKPFNAAAMAILEAAGTAWSGGMWNGSVWTGSSWSGSSWSGSSWSGSSWSGSSWSGSSWSGSSWSGTSWAGNSWAGS